MHESVAEFVERMALTLEAEGLPRIAGRLFGFLLIHSDAYSLDELFQRGHNFAIVDATAGDLADYYRMAPDAWEGMLRAAQQKWNTMRVLLTAGAAALPDEMEVARARLIEAEQFHLLLLDGVERMIGRWSRRQAGLGAEGAEGLEQPRYDASPAGASEET